MNGRVQTNTSAPDRPSLTRRAGAAAASVIGTVGAVMLLRVLVHSAATGWPGSTETPAAGASAVPSVDEVMLGLLSWAAVGLCGWLALGMAASLLAQLPGGVGRIFAGFADRLTPTVLRRAMTMLLGVSISTLALPTGSASAGRAVPVAQSVHTDTTGGAAPVATGPGFTPTLEVPAGPRADLGPAYRADARTDPEPTDPTVLHPGWRPTQPTRTLDEAGAALLAPSPRPGSAAIDTVTVRRGDSLWAIAARYLGPLATDAEIAREWPRWYAANRDLIGNDPDLVLPGQQLVPPTTGAQP